MKAKLFKSDFGKAEAYDLAGSGPALAQLLVKKKKGSVLVGVVPTVVSEGAGMAIFNATIRTKKGKLKTHRFEVNQVEDDPKPDDNSPAMPDTLKMPVAKFSSSRTTYPVAAADFLHAAEQHAATIAKMMRGTVANLRKCEGSDRAGAWSYVFDLLSDSGMKQREERFIVTRQ